MEDVTKTAPTETVAPESTAPKEITPKEPTPEPKGLSEDQISDIQKKAFGHAFGLVDQRLAEAGYVKPDGVKTTDYLVDLITSQKNKAPEGTKEQAPKVDETELGAKVKQLQTMLKEKEGELEKVKSSVSVQKRDYWVDSLVNSTPIAVPDHLSEQEKERMINRTKSLMKSELLSNYDIKEVEGKFSFYTKEGLPVYDGTPELNHIKPEALISKEFSEFLKKPESKPVVKGTGTAEPSNETTERVIPSKVKTSSEFYAYLREEKGLTMGSKEFRESIASARKERPAMFN
jgi:hypothetical protein